MLGHESYGSKARLDKAQQQCSWVCDVVNKTAGAKPGELKINGLADLARMRALLKREGKTLHYEVRHVLCIQAGPCRTRVARPDAIPTHP